MSYLELTLEAIGSLRHPHGASRAAIANYICETHKKEKNALFNSHLRKAIDTGLEKGYLRPGETEQRFKLGGKIKKESKSPEGARNMSTNTGNKKPRANAGKKTKTGNKMSTKSKSKTKTTKKRGKGSNAKSKSKTKSRSKTGRRTRTSKTNEKKSGKQSATKSRRVQNGTTNVTTTTTNTTTTTANTTNPAQKRRSSPRKGS